MGNICDEKHNTNVNESMTREENSYQPKVAICKQYTVRVHFYACTSLPSNEESQCNYPSMSQGAYVTPLTDRMKRLR